MSTDTRGISGVQKVPAISKFDEFNNIIIKIAEDKKVEGPSLKEILAARYPRSSKLKIEQLVESAQERHNKWRQRVQLRRERTAEMLAKQRPLGTPAERAKKLALDIARVQRKNATEKERKEKIKTLREQIGSRNDERFKNQETTRREAKLINESKILEKRENRNPIISTPEEHRTALQNSKKDRAAFLAESRGNKAAAQKKALEEKRQLKIAQLEKALQLLQEGIEELKKAQQQAQKKHAEINASAPSILERRATHIEEVAQLEKRRETLLSVFYNLESLFEKAQRKQFEKQVAAGNPAALAKELSPQEFVAFVEGRMQDISERMQENRATVMSAIAERFEKGKAEQQAKYLASGNPEAQSKFLPPLEYFSTIDRRIKELFTKSDEQRKQILAALERPIERIKLRNAFFKKRYGSLLDMQDFFARLRHVVALLHLGETVKDWSLIVLNTRNNLDGYSRVEFETLFDRAKRSVEPSTRTLDVSIPNDMQIVVGLIEQDIHIRGRFLRDDRRDKMIEQQGDTADTLKRNFREIIAALQQENLKSLLSGMLVDKTLQAANYLQENKPFFENAKGSRQYPHQPWNNDDSIFSRLIHSLEHTDVPHPDAVPNIIDDSIYTEIYDLNKRTPVPDEFVPIETRIRELLRQGDMFTKEELSNVMSDEQRREERIEKEKEFRVEQMEEKRQISQKKKRKQLLELLKQQNITAHQKAVDERNLIDFFF